MSEYIALRTATEVQSACKRRGGLGHSFLIRVTNQPIWLDAVLARACNANDCGFASESTRPARTDELRIGALVESKNSPKNLSRSAYNPGLVRVYGTFGPS